MGGYAVCGYSITVGLRSAQAIFNALAEELAFVMRVSVPLLPEN